MLTDNHREVLNQFHNSANNTLYSHYKAPCYDFITIQARALWLLAALSPGTVCIASACCLNVCGGEETQLRQQAAVLSAGFVVLELAGSVTAATRFL